MIEFNRKPFTGDETAFIEDVLRSNKLSGDGIYTKKCHQWFEQHLGCDKALLTPSCTHALEMAAMLIDIQPGDEVIMPSYTFVSTANAFVLRGAKIVFVDIRPDTMNIDESLIEAAITDKTKAVVPVHYAGVGCNMDRIMAIANQYDLFVIEDAAQGMMSSYKRQHLGTIGHLGAFSFHDTKNYTSGGEGGLLIVNDKKFAETAEIIREKGTNRSKFFRGMVDKYSWVSAGSSYLPSELQAAYLWGQLQNVDRINDNRLATWSFYFEALIGAADASRFELPVISENCVHNAHMFYLKLKDEEHREAFIEHLKASGIGAVFHYVPLHSAEGGKKYSRFSGKDRFTTSESERLVRLPLWYGMKDADRQQVVKAVLEFNFDA